MQCGGSDFTIFIQEDSVHSICETGSRQLPRSRILQTALHALTTVSADTFNPGVKPMISKNVEKTLQELLLDVCHIWSWTFSYDFHLLKTNCISPNLFTKVMLEDRHMEALRASRPGDAPLILSNAMGLMFSAVFGEKAVWFLGPVYTVDVSIRDIEKLLIPYHLKPQTSAALIDNLRQVPMVASSSLFEKTLMLHRLITGELTTVSDLRYHMTEEKKKQTEADAEGTRHAPHSAEKLLFDQIRQGNLNYGKVLSNAATVSPGVRARTGDPVRQAKYSVIAFITLCSRAAIDGGLPSDTAYTLADTYSTALDACSTISEVTAVSHTMYDDFIRRVHRCRAASGLSRGVRIACEYIEMHAEEDIPLTLLAQKAGYAPYYLSRKFKQETGLTPAAYLQKIRLEMAKTMLATTRRGIQDISDQLRFCSRSYFTDVFSREYGISPSAWREAHLNL